MRHIMLRTGLLCCFFALAAAGATGCGDDDGATDNGNRPDAEPDEPDSGGEEGPSFSGTVILGEMKVANLPPQAGEGPFIQIRLRSTEDGQPAPSFEQQPGSSFGCKAYEYTPAQYSDLGHDEGTIQFTAEDGPEFPPCNYVEGRGYVCIGDTGTGGAFAAGPAAGLQAFTSPDIVAADEAGRWLNISGADEPGNNGSFPIVAAGGENTVIIQNPGGVVDAESAAAMWETEAGKGPAGGADTLGDDEEVTVTLTPGGDSDLEAYDLTWAAPDAIGDAFTLDDASSDTLLAIPTDGAAFTLGCSGEGGECGEAVVNVILITTTDGDIEVTPSPLYFPPPETKSVLIQCVNVNTDEVTVSAEASAYLMNSGATRIRASYIRANLQAAMNAEAPESNINNLAGHMVTGFVTPE